jgi:hypothetical protein
MCIRGARKKKLNSRERNFLSLFLFFETIKLISSLLTHSTQPAHVYASRVRRKFIFFQTKKWIEYATHIQIICFVDYINVNFMNEVQFR